MSSQVPTKIAIVGAGAIGGVLAAALSEAGQSVVLCVRTEFQRLKRELDGEISYFDLPIERTPQDVGPVDWVLLCTKAYQVAGAAPWLNALVGPQTRIAVVQNGIEHRARVAAWVPSDRALPTIAYLAANARGPGDVVQETRGELQVPSGSLGEEFARLFAGQDAPTVAVMDDFHSVAWNKLLMNSVGGAICALALRPLGATGDPHVADLFDGLVREIVAVGRADGATFDDDVGARIRDVFANKVPGHWTSMAADRRDGRPMEWQVRNAIVCELGRKHGVPTPLCDAVTALLALADRPE